MQNLVHTVYDNNYRLGYKGIPDIFKEYRICSVVLSSSQK
jgi:hypothetical protein